MSVVCHGRRKGQAKSAPGAKLQMAQQNISMTANDLKNVTILSKNDWARINYQLNKKQIENQRIQEQKEEDKKRKDQSKDIVTNWTDTLAGQRLQKLEARRLRAEAEEEVKQKIDIEEAKYQAEQRKEAIQRAKTLQYYQSDRVKQFHGALLLTEVLKEREAQLELAKLQANANQGRDSFYLEESRRLYQEGVLKDQNEAKIRLDNAKSCANYQKAQINHHIAEFDDETENDRREGQELKLLAMQHQMEKQQIDDIRHQEQLDLLKENMRQIDDVKRMRKINRDLEDEEDDECRIFANAKRKMMILRSDKEKELHNEKQKSLEAIREKLAAQLRLREDNEDDRIRVAIEDAESKRSREEAEKRARNEKQRKEILEHTHEQMRLQEEEASLNRRKELEMLHAKMEADELFKRNEDEKLRLRKHAEQDLMHFHSKQMNERFEKAKEARISDKKLAELNLTLINDEEQQFQQYAKRVITHCKSRGRNTIPLKKAAREGMGGGLGPVFPGKGGIRPSYMTADKRGVQLPHYSGESTEQTRQTIEGDVATRKRLGFVW